MSSTVKEGALQETALGYLAGGLSLVPCSHKTKMPENDLLPRDANGKPVWTPYQETAADEKTVREWFRRGCKTVAAIGGAVSRGLLMIDFDVERFYHAWREQVGSLADGLPVQRTGREEVGYQVWLRCPKPGRNDKLAYVPDENEETGRRIAIETRGEGGYAVLPGSLHPSGKRYEAIAGDFTNIPTVPQAVADALIAAARKLDEAPLPRQQMEAKERAAKTSDNRRTESNGQGNIIDAYNERVTIQEALERYGYSRNGERYVRPGGKSGSVTFKEGRSYHHSSNDALNDGYWHRSFDLFCHYEHGGDCKAAVKAAAESLGETHDKRPAASEQSQAQKHGNDIDYHPMTLAQLMERDVTVEFLIDNIIAARQPILLAGPVKSLKTSILLDLCFALATGGSFLGYFCVLRSIAVAVLTGESGLPVIKDTFGRIGQAANIDPATVTRLIISDQIPRLSSLDHLDAIRKLILDYELELLAIDPAYLALDGADAANVMIFGQQLRAVSGLCQEMGVALLLCHHTRKGAGADHEPLILTDAAWSGFAEHCRQWLLVNHRERFDPDSGIHRLHLAVGGSAGHGGQWAVDVRQGHLSDAGGRVWDVSVSTPEEARNAVEDRREQDKAAKAQEQLERDERKILQAMASLERQYPDGSAATVIRDRSYLKGQRFSNALEAVVSDGRIIPCEIMRGNHKTPVQGYRLQSEEAPQ